MVNRSSLWFKLRILTTPHGARGDRDRGKLHEPFLARHGRNFKVAEQAYIYSPDLLEVGDDVYVGFGSYLGNGPIRLEDEVLIGNHVSITAANHLRKGNSYRFGGSEMDGIIVGRGSWIAAHACITAGVSIGEGCLVAAGAVVTKSFGDNLLIAGVPARAIGAADKAAGIGARD